MILIGDVHNKMAELKRRISGLNLFDNILIQTGDFGLGSKKYVEDLDSLDDLNTFLKKRGLLLRIIRGNHDCPTYFENAEFLQLSNIKLIKDFTIQSIEGFDTLFIGGGISTNRVWLKQGINYWPNEYVVADENKLGDYENVQLMITHVAPSLFWPKEHTYLTTQFILKEDSLGRNLAADIQEERIFMDKVLKRFNPQYWFYSHYHADKIERIKYGDASTIAICIGELSFFDFTTKSFL